jgi:hypothetical protein
MSIEKRLDDMQRDRQIKLENSLIALSRRIGRTSQIASEVAVIRQQVATLSELTDNVTRQVHQAVVQLAPAEATDNVTHTKRSM